MSYVVQVGGEADLDEAVEIDESTAELFATWGLVLDLPPEHPFFVAERRRWRESARAGRLWFAVDAEAPQVRLGFAALGHADGAAFLDQLSVRADAMRRGVGSFLLRAAIAWAAQARTAEPYLWLTTYAHLPFNRPFYERADFAVVPEPACGADMRGHLADERAHLPAPEQRVALRRKLAPA